MANRRELVLALVSDQSQFSRGIDQAEGKLKSFGKTADNTANKGGLGNLNTKVSAVRASLGGLAAAAGAAFGASKIVSFAQDAVRAFSDLNESANAVEVTFGRSSEKIIQFAKDAARSVGLSSAEAQQLVVPIGAMLQNFGLAADEAAEKAIELAKRAADMASVFNVDVSEALTAISAALRGESDPIERFGASISAARVESFLLAEGIVASKKEIDDAAKVQGRLALILEDTARVQGDFVNTADEFANAQRIAAAESENLKVIIGEALVPAFAGLNDILLQAKRAGAELFLVLSGFDDGSRAANTINLFQLQIGSAVDSAEELIGVVSRLENELVRSDGQLFGSALEDIPKIIELLDLTEAELFRLSTFSDEDLLGQFGEFGLTAPKLEILREAVEEYRIAQSRVDRDRARHAGGRRTEIHDYQDLDAALEQTVTSLQPLTDAFEANREAAQAAAEALRSDVADSVETLVSGFEGAPEKIELTTKEFIDNLTETFTNTREFFLGLTELANLGFDDLAEAIRSEGPAAIGLLRDFLEDPELARSTEVLLDNATGGLGTLADIYADAINGEKAEILSGFDTLGLDIAITLAESTRVNIRSRLGEAISSGITGVTPRSSGGGGGAGIDRRAAGGPVAAGEEYLVGERGPEIFVPNQNGQIIPNHQLGGGITVMQTFQRVEGNNVADDIQRGLLVAGLHGFAEVG